MNEEKKHICIDCDGTLVKTDLLYEAILATVKSHPLIIFKLVLWLLKGKLFLKKKLAEIVSFDWEYIPFNPKVIEVINAEKEIGNEIILATASPRRWADSLGTYLNLFDQVIASDEVNLSSKAKANKLVELFGHKNYIYAGNSSVDLEVWKYASKAIVVSNDKRLIGKARETTPEIDVIHKEKAGIKAIFKALRIYQWLKNILIFVPLFASHQVSDLSLLVTASLGFLAFSLCASSGYVINDLSDLEADRKHFRKKNRPFASCSLSVLSGFIIVPILLLSSFGLALMINPVFVFILFLYLILTISYSFRLKKQVIVDVILLACLYTIRIIAGSVATGIYPSFWLLAFSMFLFLSLAMIKRYSEVSMTLKKDEKEVSGRGYQIDDLPILRSIGVSSGLCSVLILALYINNPETVLMYPSTYWLWLIPCLLLYWISRVWLKAHRGEVHDDPVIFAAKDWQSRVILGISCLIIFAGIKL